MSLNFEKNLNIVEKCFDKAATTYDSVADIQRESSQMLISLIGHIQHINSVIDIGCGTGATSLALYKKYPDAHYTLCDVSSAMLQQAKKNFPCPVKLLCANAEDYEFSDIYDLGISNMSLQWFNDIGRFLSKILKICPTFVFSTLMYKSFQSYSACFEVSPTFDYPSMDELLDICTKSGYIAKHQTKRYIKKCANMFAVSKYFRKLGAYMKSQKKPVLKRGINLSAPIFLEYDVFFAVLMRR